MLLREPSLGKRGFCGIDSEASSANSRVAQTPVRDVCDMLIPLEAEVKSLHASAAAFLRPQSSSLRDHQHRTGFRIQDLGFRK